MELSKIESNGIEYEVKSLIEFSNLAKLLYDLSKRQKELEKKFYERDQNHQPSSLNIITDKNGYEKSSPNKNSEKSSLVVNQKTSPEKKETSKNNSITENNINELSPQKEFQNDDIISIGKNNTMNQEIVSKIIKKLNDIDKKINEITSKSNYESTANTLNIRNNKDKIEETSHKIDDTNKNIEYLTQKFSKFNEEFDAVKVKVQEFNIYDLFKGGETTQDGGNMDASKALVMTLEQKVFKKFSLYDEKYKKNESDTFKMQEDVKNIKAQLDNIKTNNQRNNDKLSEIEKNLNENIEKNDNKIEELINQLDQLSLKIANTPDFNQLLNDLNDKFNTKIEQLKTSIDESINKIKSEPPSVDNRTDRSGINKTEITKEFTKKLNDLDKNFKYFINEINVNSLRDKITALEKSIEKKVNDADFANLNNRTFNIEEYTKELNLKIESLQQFSEKTRADIAQITKKVEFLNNEYLKMLCNSQNSIENKAAPIDTSQFINIPTFNENKKDFNLKIEKLKNAIDELIKNISINSTNISRLPSDKDFIQFQNIVKNSMDEFKLACHKKYAEKIDVSKSLKLLETQIKSLSESCKKMDGSDNWLLAKKPLNNYQCASCEAMLKGDLDKKSEYIAWNKYPNRDDKTYRMGHGFSRMLQMVNEEIIKNYESKENKGYVSDEDKKLNANKYNDSGFSPENKSIKLPKVKQKGNNTDNYGISMNKLGFSPSPYEDTDVSPTEPHVTKIYKVNNKKIMTQSGFNNNSKSGNNNFVVMNTMGNFDHNKSGGNSSIDFQMNRTQTQPNV